MMDKKTQADQGAHLPLVLFFGSGFASLAYQVLWFREIRLLTGSGSASAAVVLGVFFGGLGAGAWFFGRATGRATVNPSAQSSKLDLVRRLIPTRPFRAYAVLEAGIALSALGYFVLFQLYALIFSGLYSDSGFADSGFAAWTWLAAKLALSVSLIFTPALLMGGTMPVVARAYGGQGNDGAATLSRLYAANILGAAAGAWVAGFLFPPWIGFRNAYVLMGLLNLAVAAGAWYWGGPPAAEGGDRRSSSAQGASRPGAGFRFALTLALVSGALSLFLETAWTRLFAQSLENSVYTFSLVLSVFLASQGAGAVIASRKLRAGRDPRAVAARWAMGAAAGVALALPLYHILGFAGSHAPQLGPGFAGFLAGATLGALLLVFPAGMAMGVLFPLAFRSAAQESGAPRLGLLLLANTAAGMAGALLGGFLLLPMLGLANGFAAAAGSYLVLALACARAPAGAASPDEAGGGSSSFSSSGAKMWRVSRLPRWATVATVLLIVFASVHNDGGLVYLRRSGETLEAQYRGAHAHITVTRRGEHLGLRINNRHIAGGSDVAEEERFMGHLPLILHPRPDSVLFLGMGTGITAGAALEHPVRSLMVAELLPEVALAARAHFAPYAGGLFEDPRARVVAEDARLLLRVSARRYDCIVGDLFNPEEAGALFTREHFQTVRDRLRPGGVFAQWVALYQFTPESFAILARTMVEVFPQVTLWRGDDFTRYPAVALVARNDTGAFDAAAVRTRLAALRQPPETSEGLPGDAWPFPYYIGNLTAALAADLPSDLPDSAGAGAALLLDISRAPLQTDNRPRIEYLNPVNVRSATGGSWVARLGHVELYKALAAAVPAPSDPALAGLDASQAQALRAGRSWYAFLAYREAGDHTRGRAAFEAFQLHSGTD